MNRVTSHLQNDGRDGEELSRRGELHAVVQLLPVREEPGLPLVRGLERRSFHCVHEDVHSL